MLLSIFLCCRIHIIMYVETYTIQSTISMIKEASKEVYQSNMHKKTIV